MTPAPHRFTGSLAPRARAAVAAWSAVSVLALVVLHGAGGCLVAQDLGAEDAGHVDAKLADESGSSPESGFDPQLQTADLDVSKCPGVAPQNGMICPENFKQTEKSPVQCSYASLTPFQRGGDGIDRLAWCGRSCVCAFNGTWSCIDAPCAWPSRHTCAEGMPCLAGVSCTVDCVTGDEVLCRTCRCENERFSCGKVPTK